MKTQNKNQEIYIESSPIGKATEELLRLNFKLKIIFIGSLMFLFYLIVRGGRL